MSRTAPQHEKRRRRAPQPPPSLMATLDVHSLAALGDGVGRSEEHGLVVFTPRTAPGDRVTARVTVEGRVGRGRLESIVTPSPVRVAPRCTHYEAPDRCGGCQWQHVDLTAQREAKRHLVQDAFARIGHINVPLPEIKAGAAWAYRRSLTLAIRRRADGSVFAGLRAYDDPEAVFDLHECPITDARVLDAWRAVLAPGAQRHLPEVTRLRGTIKVLDGHALFVLEGGREWPALHDFLAATPSIAAVWWQAEGKRRHLVADRRPAVGEGSGPSGAESGGPSGASFVQVNEEVAAMVHADVVERALAHAPRTVVDAYSGAGVTAVALAARGVRVVAVELDEQATALAAAKLGEVSRAVAGQPTEGSRAMAARVEHALPHLLPADVVILNPPRAGVDERVTQALARRGGDPNTPDARAAARAIIYVSCDPATLARDVARLSGWRVHALTCYDMFPQTAHVETICELRPAGVDQ